MEAIRFFSKANDREQFLDIVKQIIKDPTLTQELGEFMKMEEIQIYMKEALLFKDQHD